MPIELDMTIDAIDEISMTVDDGDEIEFGVAEGSTVRDHKILINRDAADQHPMSAITGLVSALEDCINSGDDLILNGGTSTEVIYE